jgi:flagellar motor protein MotB
MAKSANDKQPYIIGLIIFVLLTFVLAVTNYFAYKWGFDNKTAMEEAQKKESEANSKMRTAILSRKTVVQDVLGMDMDNIDTDNVEEILKQNEEILSRKKKQVDDVFSANVDPPTYTKTLDWIASSIKTHNGQMKACEDAKEAFETEKKKLVAEKDKELQDKDGKLKELQSALDEKQQELAKYQEDTTKQKDELVAEKKKAEDKLALLKSLGEEIARCKDHLSTERQKQWPGAGEGDAAADGGSDIERLKLLFVEMRDKDRAIAALNQVVAQLRVADPALQKIVRDAIPKDDRIDGFDGRILSVNEMDRTVLIALGSTDGIRPGLVFYVYDPTDPQPQIGARKGVVEVVGVEGGSLVRARVRQDATRKPILPGDAVATNLWAPGASLEVVLVGVPQFGGMAEADATRFKRIVERIGGTVETDVSPSTTIVVDGGIPKLKGNDPDVQSVKQTMSDKDKRLREKQLKEASRLGIKVVAMEPFLGMMGLQLDAVGANRLPVPADQRAAPARPENVAY